MVHLVLVYKTDAIANFYRVKEALAFLKLTPVIQLLPRFLLLA